MVDQETPFELSGAVVVLTGATRGIGKQAALLLGRGGARLVLVGRTRDDKPNPILPGTLESVAAEFGAEGIKVRTVQADLTDPEATQRVIDQTLEWYDRCDVLVNNAAFTSNGPILDVPWNRMQKAFRAQVVAPLQMVQSFVPGMLERGSGRVVNVSSSLAATVAENMSVYTTSKLAMERWTECLDLELGGRGVSFNAYHIDRVVTTEGWQYVRDTQGEERAMTGAKSPIRMTPPECAAQLVWMVTQPASWSGNIASCSDIAELGGPPAGGTHGIG
jgi:NAD(P)-dependent dehydrogenase (short-subunit alcohol dehydrogenase family)